MQQFSVKPNASDKEKPYISRNIQATRDAYGIQTDTNGRHGHLHHELWNKRLAADRAALSEANPTVSNIRLLDPNIIEPTFTQQQQIKNRTAFRTSSTSTGTPSTGRPRDYVVAVRELKADNLSGDQTNWINQHTVYTHGYGFVAAEANAERQHQGRLRRGRHPAHRSAQDSRSRRCTSAS